MDRTLVLGVDPHASSARALAWVEAARGTRAGMRVVAVHVQPRPVVAWPDPGLDMRAVEEALRLQGRERVAPVVTRLLAAGYAAQAVVRLGSPAGEVLDEAQSAGAGLVVAGTRGEGLLQGFAIGSVALRIVHGSPVPVVVVRPDARIAPREEGRPLKVLVALDGSEPAARAADTLLAWRDWFGPMRADLLHVQAPLTLFEEILPPHDDVLRQWGRAQGEAAVRAVAARFADAGVTSDLQLLAGDPAPVILRRAAELDADLIALGSRGLGAAHHALVGSVALKVAAHATVPVLVSR